MATQEKVTVYVCGDYIADIIRELGKADESKFYDVQPWPEPGPFLIVGDNAFRSFPSIVKHTLKAMEAYRKAAKKATKAGAAKASKEKEATV